MDTWARLGDPKGLLRATQRLLGLSMLRGLQCAFLEGADLYDRLIAKLHGSAGLIVATLNYDLLFEEALTRAGQTFTYPALPGVAGTIFRSGESDNPVSLFKLHGSINWLVVPDIGRGADLGLLIANTKPIRLVRSGPIVARQTSATYVPANRLSLFFELERSAGLNDPVAAVYGTGKSLLENPEHVESHRLACRSALRDLREADIVAVGLRAVSAEDDPVLADVLDLCQRLAGTKQYVSPSAADCAVFERRGFRARQDSFAAWLGAVHDEPDRRP